MPEDQNTDVPPNHLSIDPRSAFYSEEVLHRDVGIRFNGVEKTNVHEYNVAEGWVRGPSTTPVDDPTALGPIVADLLAKARGNSGMDGRTGSWPQTTLTP